MNYLNREKSSLYLWFVKATCKTLRSMGDFLSRKNKFDGYKLDLEEWKHNEFMYHWLLAWVPDEI